MCKHCSRHHHFFRFSNNNGSFNIQPWWHCSNIYFLWFIKEILCLSSHKYVPWLLYIQIILSIIYFRQTSHVSLWLLAAVLMRFFQLKQHYSHELSLVCWESSLEHHISWFKCCYLWRKWQMFKKYTNASPSVKSKQIRWSIILYLSIKLFMTFILEPKCYFSLLDFDVFINSLQDDISPNKHGNFEQFFFLEIMAHIKTIDLWMFSDKAKYRITHENVFSCL